MCFGFSVTGSKVFFSEEKKQKTFIVLGRDSRWHGRPRPEFIKVFLLLFLQKKKSLPLANPA